MINFSFLTPKISETYHDATLTGAKYMRGIKKISIFDKQLPISEKGTRKMYSFYERCRKSYALDQK